MKTVKAEGGQKNILKNIEIVGILLFYTVTAIASIIINKHFLNSIPIPLTLLLLQMVVSSGALTVGFLCQRAFRVVVYEVDSKSDTNTKEKGLNYSNLTIFESIKSLWPMIICNVFGLAFNIICLSKMDSIMHQVTRGITLPLTVLIGPFVGNDSGSWRVYLICFAIFSGFLIAVSGEVSTRNISIYGVSAGSLSSLINAYNAQFVKGRLSNKGFKAIDLVFYNNIYSTVLLTPVALVYEAAHLNHINNWKFIFLAALITGILGLLINYAGFLQIKVTSAVTHCVSSAARGIFQITASYFLLQENLGLSRSIGIGLSLISSTMYPIVKNYDNKHHSTKKYSENIELESIKYNKINIESSYSAK